MGIHEEKLGHGEHMRQKTTRHHKHKPDATICIYIHRMFVAYIHTLPFENLVYSSWDIIVTSHTSVMKHIGY